MWYMPTFLDQLPNSDKGKWKVQRFYNQSRVLQLLARFVQVWSIYIYHWSMVFDSLVNTTAKEQQVADEAHI